MLGMKVGNTSPNDMTLDFAGHKCNLLLGENSAGETKIFLRILQFIVSHYSHSYKSRRVTI